jgi:hypothetical protein
MPQWRMITELLQDIAEANANHEVKTNFFQLDRLYKSIILAHYEEIYGE